MLTLEPAPWKVSITYGDIFLGRGDWNPHYLTIAQAGALVDALNQALAYLCERRPMFRTIVIEKPN